VNRETLATAHRKIDGIEMNIKVPYRLAIFTIIIEILIFEIVLMRARREKRSSRSRYSPAQFIITLGEFIYAVTAAEGIILFLFMSNE